MPGPAALRYPERVHVTLLAVGSRGDVEPLLSLACGLRAAGHEVRLAALAPFAALVTRHGLQFASLGDLPRRFTHRARGTRVPQLNGIRGRAAFWIAYATLLRGRLAAFRAACEGSDAIVCGGLAFPAIHVAEALEVPCFWAAPVPHTHTQEFSDPFFAHRWYVSPTSGGSRFHHVVNGLSYHVEAQLRLQCSASVINRWRRDTLGLPALSRSELANHAHRALAGVLYGCSRHLVPRPHDWPEDVHLTGSWRLPSDPLWSPPSDLLEFLAGGTPPVYVGFGTMSSRDPERLGERVVEALWRSGQRGLIADLDIDPATLPAGIATVASVPHRWLFPRVSLVVHHGGAGTLAAAVEAGVPALVVPFAFDQFFWAQRLHQCGVARAPIPHGKLSATRLAAEIVAALGDSDLRARASQLRMKVGEEDGVARAIEILERSIGA